LLNLRRHHGPQRQLLPLHELRLDQRVQLERISHKKSMLLWVHP
jgi:hypothetical protein